MKQDFELIRAKEEKMILCPFTRASCRKECAWRIDDECSIRVIAKHFKPEKEIIT
jgi:hypothetical protein